MKPESVARLFALVDTSGGPDACWPSRGYVHMSGYGVFHEFEFGKPRYVHRLVYEILVGPIPDGLVLDHACHTFDFDCVAGPACLHRRCANPTHLEPVTDAENAARMGHRIQVCVNGHPFTAPNTYFRKDRPGTRSCRTCARDNARRYATAKRVGHAPALREFALSVGVLADDDVAGTADDDAAVDGKTKGAGE